MSGDNIESGGTAMCSATCDAAICEATTCVPSSESTIASDTSITVSDAMISEHDQEILQVILQTAKSNARPKTRISFAMPPDQHVCIETVERLVESEKKAVKLEQAGKIEEAIELLNQILSEEPHYASAYNNRAQLRRLANPDDASPPGVMPDLESALALARPQKTGDPVSKMQAQVLRNAYGQLAAIYLKQSSLPENSSKSWRLQLKASDMMVEASKYGEHIAAALAAAVNPYARLCGNLVETALAYYL